ncbi:IS3 family transposase [Lactobacillus xylocopicola]|nr:IS3 family transposase [Lactobacillus xylocopicola]
MTKLSKQDKIDIFNLWQNYQVGSKELSHRYRVNPSTINYLLAPIKRHGLVILDQPYTSYSIAFKAQAIRRVLVKHESTYQVSLDLELKSSGMLANWLRQYRENGYNVVNHQKGRRRHDQKRATDQAGEPPLKARERALTPAELKADHRERIRKKIASLSRPAGQEPQAAEIAQAVTELRHELKVSVTFILDTINANPDLPHLSRSNYYYTLKKSHQDQDNKAVMVEIKGIYEEHKHRYGYRRITLELRRRGLIINHKKVQRLMSKLKLFGLVSKRWHKYSSYRGIQGPIKPDLVKRNLGAIYPEHKWYSDVTEFKLKGQKTYLSPIIDGCTQEIIAYTISRSPNLKQTMDMLRQAWLKHPGLNGLVFHTDRGWQYQHPQCQAWLKDHGIDQSMSRKGNSLDDGLMEDFFGILKREMFYGFEQSFKNITVLEEAIRRYITYYNTKRIKTKLKGLTPLEYRELVLS